TCQMGGRSIRAAMELKNLGYQDVLDLRGGFGSERDEQGQVSLAGWKDSGLPTEEGEPGRRSYKENLLSANQNTAPAGPEAATPPPPPHVAPTALTPEPGLGARFAHSSRKVHCIKFGRELPSLKRRPLPGPLGDRIFNEVSAAAWEQWVEHSKMLINEY